jgi:hypothetical protein
MEKQLLIKSAEVNGILQSKFENDIVINGFSPDLNLNVNNIVEKLSQICNFNIQHVKFAYVQSKKNKSSRITVGFQNKVPKIKIFAVLKSNGNFFINQLCDNPIKGTENVALRISNRLSAFNLQIQTEVHMLKKNNKIIKYRFRNNFFQLKVNELADEWVTVGHEDIIRNL